MDLDTQNIIVSDYLKGISSPILSKRFGVSVPTITKYLHRNIVELRNPSCARRQYKLDETVFDTLTEESAYWIGCLLGDGNISILKYGQKKLNIGLAVKDENHLLKFRNFLKSNYKLEYLSPHICKGKDKEYLSQPSVRINITSKILVDKLKEFGVVPNKSFNASASDILLNNGDFWRGLIDADGTLDMYSRPDNEYYPRLRLIGSEILMNQFLKFIKIVTPFKCDVTVRSTKSIYGVSLGGKNAIYIINYLYSNSNIWLDRKFLSASLILEKNKSRYIGE